MFLAATEVMSGASFAYSTASPYILFKCQFIEAQVFPGVESPIVAILQN
jgi:hypothetical protein